jgi:cell division protein ZapA
MADEELNITIQIAGRPYKLTVNRNDEETIRKAAKHIEEQINHYAKNFHYSDKQDLLAMVVLHFASLAINNQSEVEYASKSLSPTLNEIDRILSDALLKD